MKKYNVAVVGATGLVGQNFFKGVKGKKLPGGKTLSLCISKISGKNSEF